METLPSEELRLHVVSGAIRRHLVLIVLVALAITCAVGAYVVAKPTEYVSSTKVLLGAAVGNPLSPVAASANGAQLTVAMQTEAGLVGSSGVQNLLSPQLRQQLSAKSVSITGTVPPNTQIVQIAVTAHSAAAARDDASTVASAFLRYRSNVALSSQRIQLASLAKQTAQAQNALKLASAAAAAPNALPSVSQEVQVEANRIVALQNTVSQLQTESTDPGSVIAPAGLPASPSGLSPILLILAAAILGLLLGLAIAIWREVRDDRIRSAVTAEIAGVPMLTRVPPRRADDDAEADAYRRIRAHVLGVGRRPLIVAISGTDAAPANGEVAINVGRSLVAAGYRAVVVLAVPADGAAIDILDIPVGTGLSEVLRGELRLDNVLHEVGDLRILGCGADSVASRDLYAGETFVRVLRELRADADFVLVATPPITTGNGDAAALAADAVLLTIEDRTTTREEIAEQAARAALLSKPVLGMVSLPHRSHLPWRRSRAMPIRPVTSHPAALDVEPVIEDAAPLASAKGGRQVSRD